MDFFFALRRKGILPDQIMDEEVKKEGEMEGGDQMAAPEAPEMPTEGETPAA